MTDDEMDAELDRIEAEQAELQRQRDARKSAQAPTDEAPETGTTKGGEPQEPASDDVPDEDGPSQEDYDEGRYR